MALAGPIEYTFKVEGSERTGAVDICYGHGLNIPFAMAFGSVLVCCLSSISTRSSTASPRLVQLMISFIPSLRSVTQFFFPRGEI